jgi:hypothetical protein
MQATVATGQQINIQAVIELYLEHYLAQNAPKLSPAARCLAGITIHSPYSFTEGLSRDTRASKKTEGKLRRLLFLVLYNAA